MVNTSKYSGLAFIIAILTCCMPMKAQNNHSFTTAMETLKGIGKTMTDRHALEVVRRHAVNDSNAYAMNVLGIAYMAGKGTVQDSALAVYWMEQAGKHGYKEAYNNLGMMYKNKDGRNKRYLEKAVYYFKQGTERNSVMCSYALGYMFYKGLGCTQDYTKALALFEKGVGKDHAPSLYMTGLCFRNGYGTEQNEQKAAFYLKRAAALGYSPALEELCRPCPENAYICGKNLSGALLHVQTDINDTSLLHGEYKGVLTLYDWSGTFVIGEKELALRIDNDGESFSGTMVFGNDSVAFDARMGGNGRLSFQNANVSLKERYLANKIPQVKYLLDNADLDIRNNSLSGTLSLFSTVLNEPERPMHMTLYRAVSGNETEESPSNDIKVSPNPFGGELNATFSLTERGPVTARIYDKSGICVYSNNLGTMDAGEHSATLFPNLRHGHYILSVTAGQQTLRTIIVKKSMNP